MTCLSFREATEVTFETQRADNLHLRAEVEALKANALAMRDLLQTAFVGVGHLQGSNELLQGKNARLEADLAQLREMYADRDGDLAFEFERANRLEAYLEEAATAAASGADPQDYLATKAPTTLRDEIARLTAENELYRHISVELQGENTRLTDAWLQYEHIQPNGELGANIGDVLAENELLRAENERLRAESKRLTLERLEHQHSQSEHTAAVNMAGDCPKQGWCDCPGDGEYDGDGAEDMANELAIVRSVYAKCTHKHTAPAPDARTVYAIRTHEHVLREGA